jgi:predicted nucleotidyltransferase
MANAIIENFTNKLKSKNTTLGILLFGSRAGKNNRVDSDVDLLVIQKKGFKRSVEYSDSLAFEVTYTTFKDAVSFWKNHPDDCYWLWKSRKIIFDRDKTMGKLEQIALKIIKDGKSAFDDNQISHLQFDAKDQIAAAKKLASEDIYTANLVLTQKVFRLSELFFDIQQKWTPPPKQIISTIEKESPLLANLLKQFYKLNQNFNKKSELGEKIIEAVFNNQ